MSIFRFARLALGATALSVLAGPAIGAFLTEDAAIENGTRSAALLPANEYVLRQEAELIASDSPGALKKPELWGCDYLLPEYQNWLEEGNKPENWHMAGKTFVDAESGETYQWMDWIDWINENECASVELARPEAFPLAGSILGPLLGVGGLTGVAAAAASTTPSDSPG